MYLERAKSRGNTYLYLKKYRRQPEPFYSNKISVFSFGRIENALKQMRDWEKDFENFPNELLQLGCDLDDLQAWIKTLETGVHEKSKRTFQIVV